MTGDFSEAGLTDDLEGLDPSLFTGFLEWIDFYEKTYKFVGKFALMGHHLGEPFLFMTL